MSVAAALRERYPPGVVWDAAGRWLPEALDEMRVGRVWQGETCVHVFADESGAAFDGSDDWAPVIYLGGHWLPLLSGGPSC